MRRMSAAEPRLESGSLRLPHFGDCTHDGQPDSHGHSLDEPVRVGDQLLERSHARSRVIPTPPGCPS